MNISQKAIDQIIKFEVTSEELYNKRYLHPIWPGGDSGVTVGIGYDLGFNSSETIIRDWTGEVNLNFVSLMADLAGVTGERAKVKCSGLVKNITVPYSAAINVFKEKTLPRYYKMALNTYPGLEELNADTQGAIVSLVYNRGTSFGKEGKPSWESRREMRELKSQIANQEYPEISETIRKMKRLWIDNDKLGGLVGRRELEATLVDDSIA